MPGTLRRIALAAVLVFSGVGTATAQVRVITGSGCPGMPAPTITGNARLNTNNPSLVGGRLVLQCLQTSLNRPCLGLTGAFEVAIQR